MMFDLKLSPRGAKLIKSFEKFEPRVYPDSGGKLTIGFGHLITPRELKDGFLRLNNSTFNWEKDALTLEQANTLFLRDVVSIVEPELAARMELHNLTLNQHQYDALASWIFNVGPRPRSEVWTHLAAGREEKALEVLSRYINPPSARNGLIKRRAVEVALFKNEDYLKLMKALKMNLPEKV